MTQQIINKLGNGSVLVFGDIMLDRYIWGEVARISPEAPVPIIRVMQRSEVPGGAGNVATNLAGLGCHMTLVGIIADDSAGRSLQHIFDSIGVGHRLVLTSSHPTITKTRVMAQNQQLLRIDEEEVALPSRSCREEILLLLEEILPKHNAVILSDYGKGALHDPAIVQRAIQLAGECGIPVLVDPKGKDWSRYRGATCVTPNTAELEAIAVSHTIETDADLITAAQTIKKTYDLRWLLATRGKLGMCLVGEETEPFLVPAQAREVFDVSGAGDTVIATMAWCLAGGLSFKQAVEIANVAAGVVVGKLGTQPITDTELKAAWTLYASDNNFPNSSKINSLEVCLARVTQWKSAGQKIVFTNGCFDLLHPGHLQLLRGAKRLGDRLVVGLNSDASVKRLKGHARPVNSQDDRAVMLSALPDVDAVVLFSEDTPLSLIESLRPDILVKGADYQDKQVVGREVVESYGGTVKLVSLLDGHSSTGIVQRLSSGNGSRQQNDLLPAMGI